MLTSSEPIAPTRKPLAVKGDDDGVTAKRLSRGRRASSRQLDSVRFADLFVAHVILVADQFDEFG